MNAPAYRFCPQCATPLALISADEDGGPKERLRCPACGYNLTGLTSEQRGIQY